MKKIVFSLVLVVSAFSNPTFAGDNQYVVDDTRDTIRSMAESPYKHVFLGALNKLEHFWKTGSSEDSLLASKLISLVPMEYEARDFDALVQHDNLDARAAQLLPINFIGYFQSIERTINPSQQSRDCTGLYAASGPDVSSFLLATDCNKAIFADIQAVDLQLFERALNDVNVHNTYQMNLNYLHSKGVKDQSRKINALQREIDAKTNELSANQRKMSAKEKMSLQKEIKGLKKRLENAKKEDIFALAKDPSLDAYPRAEVIARYVEKKKMSGGAISENHEFRNLFNDTMLDVEIKIIHELDAIGVDRQSIHVDHNTNSISFTWQYGHENVRRSPRVYQIYFVKTDITEPEMYPQNMKDILRAGIEVYFQKASVDIAGNYEKFASDILEYINPNGFFISNDYPTMTSSKHNTIGVKDAKAEPYFEPFDTAAANVRVVASKKCEIYENALYVPKISAEAGKAAVAYTRYWVSLAIRQKTL